MIVTHRDVSDFLGTSIPSGYASNRLVTYGSLISWEKSLNAIQFLLDIFDFSQYNQKSFSEIVLLNLSNTYREFTFRKNSGDPFVEGINAKSYRTFSATRPEIPIGKLNSIDEVDFPAICISFESSYFTIDDMRTRSGYFDTVCLVIC